jgi:hypothetical protein
MTVLQLGRRESATDAEATAAQPVEAAASGANKTGDMDVREARARRLDVAVHVESLTPEDAVTRESRKGYDLIIIGVERTTADDGSFHEQIARMAAGFAGPLAS